MPIPPPSSLLLLLLLLLLLPRQADWNYDGQMTELFVLYLAVFCSVNVVLMNLFIARMTSKYSECMRKADRTRAIQRFEVRGHRRRAPQRTPLSNHPSPLSNHPDSSSLTPNPSSLDLGP